MSMIFPLVPSEFIDDYCDTHTMPVVCKTVYMYACPRVDVCYGSMWFYLLRSVSYSCDVVLLVPKCVCFDLIYWYAVQETWHTSKNKAHHLMYMYMYQYMLLIYVNVIRNYACMSTLLLEQIAKRFHIKQTLHNTSNITRVIELCSPSNPNLWLFMFLLTCFASC